MKLTYKDAIDCLNALKTLDSTPKIIVDGGREKVVAVPLTFTPNVRIAIAKNIVALTAEARAYEIAFDQIGARYGNGLQPIDEEKAGEFTAAVNDLLGQETGDMTLVMLTEADLNMGQNAIPPTAIAGFMPCLNVDA